MAFAEWAYSFLFCYHYVYKIYNNKASMIVFLAIANLFWLITLISWTFIIIKGPGKLPLKILPYDLSYFVRNGESFGNSKDSNSTESFDMLTSLSSSTHVLNTNTISPPEMFECDFNGLPYWCFQCSSLKPLRSHHSSVTNTCIPMFDHFCTFVGFTIGKDNFYSFISFVLSMEILLLFTCITIIIYSGIKNQLHSALIVFIICTGILAILVGNLFLNLIYDLKKGETNIESMGKKRWIKDIKINESSIYSNFINVQHPNNPKLRLIVKLSPMDRPYDKGFWNNLLLWNTDFNKFTSSIEISEFQNSMFSNQFKKNIMDRIDHGDYVVFGSQTKLMSVKL